MHLTTLIAATAAVGVAPLAASADTFTRDADADGFATINLLGFDSVNTTGTTVSTTQSGSLGNDGLFAFDLASLPAGATITNATLSVRVNLITNTGGNPAAVRLFGFTDDDIVIDEDDFAPNGPAATTGSLIDSESFALSNIGFDFDFTFDSLAEVQAAADAGGVFNIRSETDSFASFLVASSESTGTDAFAPNLTLTFTPVPEPTAIAAFTTLAGLVSLRRRR